MWLPNKVKARGTMRHVGGGERETRASKLNDGQAVFQAAFPTPVQSVALLGLPKLLANSALKQRRDMRGDEIKTSRFGATEVVEKSKSGMRHTEASKTRTIIGEVGISISTISMTMCRVGADRFER